MSTATDPSRDELISLATDLIARGNERGTPVRALGGLGIDLRATDVDPRLRRPFADVDLAGAQEGAPRSSPS